MVKALFDTNILIDHLHAVPEARVNCGGTMGRRSASLPGWRSWSAPSRTFRRRHAPSLAGFEVIGIDERVAERAVELRRSHRIRLPDAVTWATAQVHGLLLVTRNTRDFPADDPGVRLPYTLRTLSGWEGA